MTEEEIILALVVELETRFPEPRLFAFDPFPLDNSEEDGWGLQLKMVQNPNSTTIIICKNGRFIVERHWLPGPRVAVFDLHDPTSIDHACCIVDEWVTWHFTDGRLPPQ